MELVKNYYEWLLTNGPQLAATLTALVVFLEAAVKLTPTETDDGAVHRIGALIDKLLSWIPSVKK